jgi:hypothetical protein
MDIEEIKCPLCQEFYDEHDKTPILLPDCGHSYCYWCICRIFEDLEEQQLQMDLDYRDEL